MSLGNTSNIDPSTRNPLAGPEALRGTAIDSTSEIIQILDSLLNPQESNSDSSFSYNLNGVDVVFNIDDVATNSTGEVITGTPTVQSALEYIAAQLADTDNQELVNEIQGHLDNYSQSFANKVNDLLSIGEARNINNLETAINSNASSTTFDTQVAALETALSDQISQLSEIDSLITSNLMGTMGSDLIGNVGKAGSEFTEIDLGNGQVIRFPDNITLANTIYGLNGLDASINAGINGGLDDYISSLLYNADEGVMKNVEGLIVSQFMEASKTNIRLELAKRPEIKEEKNGEVETPKQPIPPAMQSFTPWAAAALGIAKELSGQVETSGEKFFGTEEGKEGALAWKTEKVNIAPEGQEAVYINMKTPIGSISEQLFQPFPVDEIQNPQIQSMFDDYLLREGHVNKVNMPIQDFNQFLQDNIPQIKAQIQQMVIQNLVNNPQVLTAKLAVQSAKQDLSQLRINLGQKSDQLSNFSQTKANKEAQKSQLQAALQQPGADTVAINDQLNALDQEINSLQSDMANLQDEISVLGNQEKIIQKNVTDALIDYSDLVTDKIDNQIEADIATEIGNIIDPELSQLQTDLENAHQSLANDITGQGGALEQLTDLINDNLISPDFTGNEDNLRGFSSKLLLLMILDEGSWEDNRAASNPLI